MILKCKNHNEAKRVATFLEQWHPSIQHREISLKEGNVEDLLEKTKDCEIPFLSILDDGEKQERYEMFMGRIVDSKIYLYPYGNPYPAILIHNNNYEEARPLRIEEILSFAKDEEERKDIKKRYHSIIRMACSNRLLLGYPLYEEISDEDFTFPDFQMSPPVEEALFVIMNHIFS